MLRYSKIIRAPLSFVPLVFSGLAGSVVAVDRISKFLAAEELDDPYVIDDRCEHAVEVNGDFTWETSGATSSEADRQPFELKDLRLSIPRGAFVAIVGRVGSGKVIPKFDSENKGETL